MPALRDIALRTRLDRSLALTTVLALGLACGAIIAYQYGSYRRQVVSQVGALAEVVAVHTAAALAADDRKTAAGMLDSFITNPEILAARIYTAAGESFAEYLRPGAVAAPLPLTEAEEWHEFRDEQLILRRRIRAGEVELGVVSLRADMRPAIQRLRHSILIVLGCMALAAVVALAVAQRFHRYVLDPILDLAGVAERVAQTRDYGLRGTPQSQDEVGALTRTFNDMLGQIQQRDREVSEAYTELAQTTSRLLTSEEQFRQLAENIAEVFWLTTVDKAVLMYVSPAYETVWGRSRKTLYAAPALWLEAVHPADRDRVRAAVPAQLNGEYDEEYRVVRPDGSVRWVRDRAFPILDGTGRVYRLAGLAHDITERKEAELAIRQLNESLEERVRERTAALLESEGRLRMALDASKAGVWSWDVVTNRADWDAQYHAMYGFAPEEPVAHEAWLARIYPADRVRLVAQLQTLLQPQGGAVWNEDFRVVHPVRGVRWMTGLGKIERDAAGKAVRFSGINLDITERKEAEEAIRQLNEDLEQRVRERTRQLETINRALHAQQQEQQTILDSVPALIWYKDRHNRIVRLNRSAAAAIGRTVAEMEGRLTDEFYPEQAARFYRDDLAVLESGQPKLGIVESFADATGRRQWLQTDKVPFCDERGEILGIIVCAVEITTRIEAEQAAQESRERLEAIMDNSTAVIYLKAADGKYLLVNRHFEDLFGVGRNTIAGKTDYDIFPQAVADEFRKNDERVLREKRSLQFEEVAVQQDSLRTFVSVKFPFCDAAGNAYAVCGISTDITERYQLQRQVFEVSDREQRRIGQDLHDGLCQVLTGTGFAIQAVEERLAAAGGREVPAVQEIAELVKQANAQARDIARGLHPVELEYGGLLSALRELAHRVGQLYKIDCQLLCEPGLAQMPVERAIHVYRIVQEAVTNALKHSGATRIEIRLAQAANTVALAVTDNGRGLAELAGQQSGMGFNIMAYRARMIEGTLRVEAGSAGGTAVQLVFSTT